MQRSPVVLAPLIIKMELVIVDNQPLFVAELESGDGGDQVPLLDPRIR